MKTKIVFRIALFCSLFLFVLSFILAPSAPAQAQTSWVLQWSDEFSGAANTGVSTANWLYDTGHCYPGCPAGNWGTGEIENMTTSTANVYQDGGGHLVIKPIKDASGNWTSGRIETQRTNFQPPAGGIMRIEGRIQQPNVSGASAAGYWPAFWALGAPFRGVYTNWPSIGELDIMEDINGLSSVFGTLHCGTNPGGPCNETTGLGSGQHACAGCQTAYHTYAIEYDKSVSPQQLRFYLDTTNYFTIKANQVDATTWSNATNHGFFVILNVAMGGGFPGAFGGGPTSSTASGIPMLVDYVRVYYSSTGSSPTATTPGSTAVPPTNTPVASGDFSRGVTRLNATQAQITFTSNVNSAWVDVHYTVTGGCCGQQNFRMTKNGSTWTQTVSGLSTGSVITYWFTYEKAGLAYDTAHYTYTQ